MLGIRHVALKVRDIRRSVEFYSVLLKMRVEWQPDPKNVYLTSGNDNLALHEIEAPSEVLEVSTSLTGLDHFGFMVSSPQEVDKWAHELEAGGIQLVQQPQTHRDGARSIYFRDPDGHLIQLLYHPPIS